MVRVIDEQLALHPGVRLAALHRVGELAIGDIAVVVAASAAHRDAAFAACRGALDGIKASAPIWKKEWSPDGSALWVNLEHDERT
jgi:molybdopterin synthase catalytic subunit